MNATETEKKDWMMQYSLNEVERMYHNGILTEDEVEEYIKRWNATPSRFTHATFIGYNIYNHIKK